MAGYWLRFIFASLLTSTSSRSINSRQKKNLAHIQPSWLHTWSITHTSCLTVSRKMKQKIKQLSILDLLMHTCLCFVVGVLTTIMFMLARGANWMRLKEVKKSSVSVRFPADWLLLPSSVQSLWRTPEPDSLPSPVEMASRPEYWCPFWFLLLEPKHRCNLPAQCLALRRVLRKSRYMNRQSNLRVMICK